MKTNDSDTNNGVIKSTPVPDEQTPFKENQSLRLTPELVAKVERSNDALDRAIIEGLHRDNLEIFGEDYIKK